MSPTTVRIPALAPRCSVTLTERRVPEGDTVLVGEALCVLECQKADHELLAKVAGRVEWLMEEGATAAAGANLCRIHEPEPAEQDVLDEVGTRTLEAADRVRETLSKFRGDAEPA